MKSIDMGINEYVLNNNSTDSLINNVTDISCDYADATTANDGSDVEKYFRPSKESILNNRNWEGKTVYNNLYGVDYQEISVPKYFMKTPEDTIINYFSVLREAANQVDGKSAGCGSIGSGRVAYPIAYNFLTDDYKSRLGFEDYKKTFQNILHMNLVKMKKIPVYNSPPDTIRYFVEIETIEGSESGNGTFAYYFGFIDIVKEGNQYKISNIELTGEQYLCAPYHSWFYDAEAAIEIKYGGWCNLIKKRCPTVQEGYMKKIFFKGTDGREYLFIYFILTNDYDIEIAQYIKDEDGSWKLIKIIPEECIRDKES